MIPSPPSPEALQAMPKPTELVDRGFEIADQLLAAQHSFAKKLMASLQRPLTEAAGKAASAARAGDSITQTVKNAFSKD